MRTLGMVVMLVACGNSGSKAKVDVSIDVPPPTGNFSCAGQPLKTTAASTITIAGRVFDSAGSGIAGASIEIHSLTDDSLLGQGMSGSAGGYGVSLTTGGTAPSVYRKVSATGKVDDYIIDAFPLFFSPQGPGALLPTAAEITSRYQAAGVTQDPSKTSLQINVIECPDATGAANSVMNAVVTVGGAEKVMYENSQGADDPNLHATVNGVVDVFNVPVGPADVTIVAGPYTYRAWPFSTHAGAVTYALLAP